MPKSFEGEFNRRYPVFKYQSDEKFRTAKDLLLKTIDAAVSGSGVSINNKANIALKSFRKMIVNTDTTIKEKFEFCMDQYADEIAPLVEKYARMEGIDKNADLAQAYADYRNRTAHGTIPPVSGTEKITFQLLRCFIYVLILESGKVPHEKIKKMISRMF